MNLDEFIKNKLQVSIKFGITDLEDLQFIEALLQQFESESLKNKFNVFPNSKCYQIIGQIISHHKQNTASQGIASFKTFQTQLKKLSPFKSKNKNAEFFTKLESILTSYNICNAYEVIDMVKKSNDKNILELAQSLSNLDLVNINASQCSITVFFLTKKYKNSFKFEHDMTEAISLNKLILVIMLDKINLQLKDDNLEIIDSSVISLNYKAFISNIVDGYKKIYQMIYDYVNSLSENYLLYTDVNRSEINRFFDNLSDFNLKEMYVWKKHLLFSDFDVLSESSELNYWILKFYYLTKKSINYKSFRKSLEASQLQNKIIIFVMLETIDAEKEFKDIDASNIIVCDNSELNTISFENIKVLLHQPHPNQHINTIDYAKYIQEIYKISDYYSFYEQEKQKINDFIVTIGFKEYAEFFKWQKSLIGQKEGLDVSFNQLDFYFKVFILTREKIDSEHFRKEYESGLNQKKALVFILLENIDIEKHLSDLDISTSIIFLDSLDAKVNFTSLEVFKGLLYHQFRNGDSLNLTYLYESLNQSNELLAYSPNEVKKIEEFYKRIEKKENGFQLVDSEKYLVQENQKFKVYFLNQEQIDSVNFKIDINLLRASNKLKIYVYLENVENNIAVDSSNSISFVDPIESETNDEAFIILKRFLFNLTNESLIDYTNDIQEFLTKRINMNSIKRIQKLSSDKIMLTYEDDSLSIFNINSCTIVNRLFAQNPKKLHYYWISHLDSIITLEDLKVEVLDINGSLIRQFKVSNLEYKCSLRAAYSGLNKKTYIYTASLVVLIYDLNLNFERKISLNIVNPIQIGYLMCLGEKVFAFIENFKNPDEIHVFDLNLNYFTIIENVMRLKNMKSLIVYDPNEPNYFFLQMNKTIQIFGTKHLSVIGLVNKPYNLLAVNGNKMLFNHENSFYICKMNFIKKEKKFEEKLICKLDPFNTHLYKNPSQLPCGNTACMDCLWKNIFIENNKFICCFTNCQQMHSVNYKLPKDLISTQYILDSLAVISPVIIDEFKEASYSINQDEFIQKFESIFEMLELKFELRVQSLHLKLDQLSEKLFDKIFLFEKNVQSKKINGKFQIKILRNKIFKSSQIGSILCNNLAFHKEDEKCSKNSKKLKNNDEEIKFLLLMNTFFN